MADEDGEQTCELISFTEMTMSTLASARIRFWETA